MPAIIFPASSSPGVKPQEGGGRLVNAYAIKTPQGAREQIMWVRSAGLNEILNITGHSHCRGMIVVGSTLLVVLDEGVYAVTRSGSTFSASNLGSLPGTDLVTLAKNNAATPNIVAVCADGVFNLFIDAAPSSFADGDLPAVLSVAHMDGYLLFPTGSGQIWATGLNNVSVATNSFTTAQGRSDGLLRIIAFRKEAFAFGQASCEVYRDIGASPFPLEFVTMIPRGLAGTHAVSGWEEGWANDLIWAADDNVVYRLEGYTPVPISNDDVSRAIEVAIRAGEGSLLSASCYMAGKNAFWKLTNPGQWTWEWNKTTNEWNERGSYSRSDWRARCAVRAFDRWIVGDDTTGKLFEVRSDVYREGTDPLVWQVESGIVANFPARQRVPRADFDITAAVGSASGESGIETDPKVAISWSKDGGYTHGNPVLRTLGAEGASKHHPFINRLGLIGSRGIRFRLQVSDPVHVGLMGGQMASQQRAA